MSFSPNTTPTFTKQPRIGLAQIANADASNLKTLVTAGANGSKVMGINASSTDTSGRDIQLTVTRSSVNYILWTVTVGAGAGNAGSTPSVDLMTTTDVPAGLLCVDHDGQHYINLESGDTLSVSSLTTVTSGKFVSAAATYEDF